MADEFYNELVATASEVLREFGQLITLSRPTQLTYDPVTNLASGSGLQVVGELYAVEVSSEQANSYQPKSAFSGVARDPSQVLSGDVMMLLEGNFDPQLGDKITNSIEETYNVVWKNRISPAGITVVCFVQLRK
jgi:hypothetical protein